MFAPGDVRQGFEFYASTNTCILPLPNAALHCAHTHMRPDDRKETKEEERRGGAISRKKASLNQQEAGRWRCMVRGTGAVRARLDALGCCGP